MDLSSIISASELERLGFISKKAAPSKLQRMSQYSMSQVDLSQMDLTQGAGDGFEFSQAELSQVEGAEEMDMSLEMGDGPGTAPENHADVGNVNLSDLLGRVLILGDVRTEYGADEDVQFMVSINLPNLNHILHERSMTAAPVSYINLRFALTSARESEPPELEIPNVIEQQEQAFPHKFDNNECSATVTARFKHGPDAVMWAVFKVDGVDELLYLRTRSAVKVNEYRLVLANQRKQLVQFADQQNKHISKVVYELLGEDLFQQCIEKHAIIEITKIHPTSGTLHGNQPVQLRLRAGVALSVTSDNIEIYFGNQQATELKVRKYQIKDSDTTSSSTATAKRFYRFYQVSCRTPPFPQQGKAELTVLHKGIHTSAVSSFEYTTGSPGALGKRKLEHEASEPNKRRKTSN